MISVCTVAASRHLYPVPHEVSQVGKKTLNLSKGIALSDPQGLFAESLDFLTVRTKGVGITVDFGKGVAEQNGVKSLPGAYLLDITPKGITVTGYDEEGAFHALQTLRHMVAMSDGMRVQCCRINDWPDKERRGFADCFNGGTWSQEFRMSMIELAASLKMNEYVYAPKDDPYVGCPDWIMPYPQGMADDLKELIDACRDNRIDFTWCIRPDSGFTWSEADYSLLLGKFEMMHYLGVRSFGIFLDDVAYTDGIEEKKKELVERLNSEFIARKKGLKPLRTTLEGCYVPSDAVESARLGMYGVADKSWNDGAYDPRVSMERAVNEIAPDIADSYMTYALNSSVSEMWFGLEESDGMELIGLEGYSQESYDALMNSFKAIENAAADIASNADRRLYADLRPWIEQFGKLGARCRRILECVALYNEGDIPGFWSTYAANLMSDEDRKVFLLHPSGTVKLQPYYERMMKDLADAFDQTYKDKVGYTYIPGDGMETYFAPAEASSCHLILDNPEGREVIVRLSDVSGRYTAEFCIDESYFEFEMKEDAVKVEVIGDVKVFETVFVK